jgi:hypothetical protein
MFTQNMGRRKRKALVRPIRMMYRTAELNFSEMSRQQRCTDETEL